MSRPERPEQRGKLGSNEGHQNTLKRETQIKTTGRHYLTATGDALGKRENNKCWRGRREGGTLKHAGGVQNGAPPLEDPHKVKPRMTM